MANEALNEADNVVLRIEADNREAFQARLRGNLFITGDENMTVKSLRGQYSVDDELVFLGRLPFDQIDEVLEPSPPHSEFLVL